MHQKKMSFIVDIQCNKSCSLNRIHSNCWNIYFISALIIVWSIYSSVNATNLHAAESWRPTKTTELIVPTSPGGGTDETARILHSILQGMSGPEMIVINRGGAGGGIAYAYMNKFEGSGHHLSLSLLNLVTNSMTGTHQISPKDVTPIAHLFSEYPVFVVRTDSQIMSGKDLMSRLKKDPVSHNFAFSPGLGGALHLATGIALKAANINPSQPTMVVYQSAGGATAAVLGGHVDVGVMNPPVAIAQSKAGKVRIIAVGAPKRLGGALADVATWKEQGIDAVFASWRGVIGPGGMTAAQISYWENQIERVVKTEAWKRHLETNDRENEFMGGKKTQQYLEQQSVELGAAVTSLGLLKK